MPAWFGFDGQVMLGTGRVNLGWLNIAPTSQAFHVKSRSAQRLRQENRQAWRNGPDIVVHPHPVLKDDGATPGERGTLMYAVLEESAVPNLS